MVGKLFSTTELTNSDEGQEQSRPRTWGPRLPAPPEALCPVALSCLRELSKVPASLSSSWGLQLTDFHRQTPWYGDETSIKDSKVILGCYEANTCPGPVTAGMPGLSILDSGFV